MIYIYSDCVNFVRLLVVIECKKHPVKATARCRYKASPRITHMVETQPAWPISLSVAKLGPPVLGRDPVLAGKGRKTSQLHETLLN